jgi:hypothetical protein
MVRQSKIVGKANRNVVYEALVELKCGYRDHGAVIKPGERFTRGSTGIRGMGQKRVPVCAACYPFEIIEEA